MMSIETTNIENIPFPKIPASEGLPPEWAYTMRREMQEIVPGVFLGPYASAMKTKLDYLLSHNISHIVCIRQSIEANFIRPNFTDKVKYLVLDVADSVSENIIRHFPIVKEFVEECHRGCGNVLIHGNAGISRSAALVIAYVMEKYGLTYKQAFRHVQARRFCINPNDGFAQQLQEYEPIYLARLTSQTGQTSQNNCGSKRKFIDEESGDMDTN